MESEIGDVLWGIGELGWEKGDGGGYVEGEEEDGKWGKSRVNGVVRG